MELAHGDRRLSKISGIRELQKPHAYIISQKDSFLRIFQKRHVELFLQKLFWLLRVRVQKQEQ